MTRCFDVSMCLAIVVVAVLEQDGSAVRGEVWTKLDGPSLGRGPTLTRDTTRLYCSPPPSRPPFHMSPTDTT